MDLVIQYRSAQIAIEKRKEKIGFILAINKPNRKVAEPAPAASIDAKKPAQLS